MITTRVPREQLVKLAYELPRVVGQYDTEVKEDSVTAYFENSETRHYVADDLPEEKVDGESTETG